MASGFISFILALGLGIRTAECGAGPLSSSGCACKSGCDVSWLSQHGGSGKEKEWCYVDTQCQTRGWDSCHDTVMLYNSALDDKKKAEIDTYEEKNKRIDAEKKGQAVVAQLRKTKLQLQDSDNEVTSLEKQLKETEAKEVAAEQKEVAAEQNVKDSEAKYAAKLKDAADLKEKSEVKIKEATIIEHKAAEQMKDSEEKVKQAQVKQSDAEKRFQVELYKVEQAEVHQHEAEIQQHKAESNATKVSKDADSRHNKDVLDLSNAELRQVALEKTLQKTEAKARDAYTKFTVTAKAMDKLKAASKEESTEASLKLIDTEKKLQEETHLEEDVEAKLKTSWKQQTETEKKLEVIEKKEHNAVAELKPFRAALRKAASVR